MTELPTFEEFYRAVHRRDPFPWQSRLAALVEASGWPADIGVPTGLGKTAAIDIAVWSLARSADLPGAHRRAPRRIWYVVDRRLLVDAASDHASRLAALLAEASHGPLAAIAEALRSLCAVAADRPLHVSRLRGGISEEASSGRVPDPARPAVLCSTVAMYASRLLFRGYGVSRSLWPIEAAHAGTDALVLLDEAHLAPALRELLSVLPDCDASRTGLLRFPPQLPDTAGPGTLLPAARAYPQLVNLTATGADGAFDLDEHDHAHPVVARRLRAAKPTTMVATTSKDLPATLAEQVWSAVEQRGASTTAVVFTNSPHTARAVAEHLQRRTSQHCGRGGADLMVLTGQLRDPDAEQVRSRLLHPASGVPSGARAERTGRDRPLIVVATQTLEVGADLDFDVCVSETAGVRAIVQRWGRLNRLGEIPDALGVLVHPEDRGEGGLYGTEPAQVWTRLHEHQTAEGDDTAPTPLDLGPQAVATLLGPAQDRPERLGTLLPAHLWEFAKTTVPPAGAAPPEVFFDTIDEPDLRAAVLWRCVVPAPGEALFPAVSVAETVEVPLPQLREFLNAHPGAHHRAVVLSNDGVTVTAAEADTLSPGAQVVLPAAAGGYSSSGWDPHATETVNDLSPTLRNTLHLTAAAVNNLLGAKADAEMVDSEPVDSATADDELAELMRALAFDPDEGPDPDRDAATARALARALAQRQPDGPLVSALRPRIERVGADLHPVLRWDAPRNRAVAQIDALDGLSNAPRAGLADHLAAVGELAHGIAIAIGLEQRVADALAVAGRLHDLGKADPRFQRWLGGTDADQPLAKSAMSQTAWRRAATAAGWPVGGRHELLSAQIITAYLDQGGQLPDADLVTHLVTTHHGNGRPIVPTTEDGGAVTTKVNVDGHSIELSTDTGNADWAQPDRFRSLSETYGHWGLALLEAIVRQADHRVSAATDVI